MRKLDHKQESAKLRKLEKQLSDMAERFRKCGDVLGYHTVLLYEVERIDSIATQMALSVDQEPAVRIINQRSRADSLDITDLRNRIARREGT